MSWSKALRVNPKASKLVGDDLETMLREKLGPKIVGNAKRLVPVLTAKLQHSIEADVIRESDAESTLIVGTDVDYGKWVEDGTSKMAAQPFLRPAVYQAKGVVA